MNHIQLAITAINTRAHTANINIRFITKETDYIEVKCTKSDITRLPGSAHAFHVNYVSWF